MCSGKIFNEFIGKLEKLIPVINQYKVKVLYGFKWNGGAGTYLYWMLNTYFDIEFDYIIDDDVIGERIYRKNLLDYLNPDETIIISATDADLYFINSYGYQKNRNWFDIREWYSLDNIGYFEYMESNYDLDIIGRETAVDVNIICEDASKYAVSRGMGLPTVCQYLKEHYKMKNVLDIGCGKGGAIITFKDFGFDVVDGIELLEELCITAKNNMSKMKINSNIICMDALKFNDYDKYNLFYMYDPFRGITFMKTIKKIRDSIERFPREAIIVYANPWEHKSVIKDDFFELHTQIEGDWFTRMANVYKVKQRG